MTDTSKYSVYIGGRLVATGGAIEGSHDLQIGDGRVIVETLSDFAERLHHENLDGADLDATWRAACGKEALRVWPDFKNSHPYAVQEPDGTQITPGPGVAYPSLLAAHLEARTGVAGWRVELVRKPHGWEFSVTRPQIPPPIRIMLATPPTVRT